MSSRPAAARLVHPAAGIVVLALESKLLREFGEPGPCVVLLETITPAAALIRRTIGAFVGGSPERHQLVEAVAHARERAREAIHDTDRVAGVIPFAFLPAKHGDRQFLDTPKDVADGTTKLAGRRVLRRRRRLDVAIYGTYHCQKQD